VICLILAKNHCHGAATLCLILVVGGGISTKNCIPGYELGGTLADIVFGLLFSSRKLTYIVSPEDIEPGTITAIDVHSKIKICMGHGC